MLTEEIKSSLRYAAKQLGRHKKRAFMAKVAQDHFDGSPSKTERAMGWGREAVKLGLHEMKSGIICIGNYSARGRPRTERNHEGLEKDIQDLVEHRTQTDPKFRTAGRFCKISAQSVCAMLEEEKGYQQGTFKVRNMSNILNRMGYSLKKNLKNQTP